jgi:pimeloyl-ACP methyl ester carboxylesterase
MLRTIYNNVLVHREQRHDTERSDAMTPETRYADSDGVSIAYQVVGSGPIDLVFVPGWLSNVEVAWEGSEMSRFLQRLASFSRLILFDKRGTGLSDRVGELPTLEQRMDDVRAVMDAAGSERAALFGFSEGGSMAGQCRYNRVLEEPRLARVARATLFEHRT